MKKTRPTHPKNSSSTAPVPEPAPLGANAWNYTRPANPNPLPRTIAFLARATRVLPSR